MKKRRFSLWPRTLRAQLALLLLVFWVVPMIALATYTVFVYRGNVSSELRTTMDSRIYYAALLSSERLNSVVSTAREISYDDTLQSLCDSFEETDKALASEDDPKVQKELRGHRNELKADCVTYLDSQFSLDRDFSMAVLYFGSGSESWVCSDFTEGNLFDYYMTFAARRARSLSSSLGTDAVFLAYNEHLYLLRELRRTDNTGVFGWLVLELNTDTIFSFLLDAVPGDSPFYVQIGSASLILRADEYGQEKAPLITRNMSGISEDLSYVTFAGWFDSRDFSMGYQVPLTVNYLDGYFNRYNRVLLLIGAVSVICFILIYFSFNRHFSKPLESLSNVSWALQNGELGVHANYNGNDELGDLVNSFNNMSDRMKELFDRIYKEQLALKDARIIALQSQINPHFFNNTLELMNWKARMLGDDQLSDMITALSTMLDSAMDRSNTRFVTVRQELDVAEAYLTIIQARLGRRLTVVQDVDESLLELPMPRMILQPLLENAVVHGLEPAGGGILTLSICSEGSQLSVSILNNGTPLSSADLSRIDHLLNEPVDRKDPRSQRLGIRNVSERLTLIYGPDAALRFFRDETDRTVCCFRIPKNVREVPREVNL